MWVILIFTMAVFALPLVPAETLQRGNCVENTINKHSIVEVAVPASSKQQLK